MHKQGTTLLATVLSTIALNPPTLVRAAAGAEPRPPEVNITLLRGASLNLPFPRVCEFEAIVRPKAGAAVRLLEWDWEGNGEYGRPTPWDQPERLRVVWAHDYGEKTGPVRVRLRARDSAGSSGVGELVVNLPAGEGTRRAQPRSPLAGIYTQWSGGKPVYRGGSPPKWLAGWEAFTIWQRVEKAPGTFDFGAIDGSDPKSFNGQVRQIIDCGKHVVFHINAAYPDWLFDFVGRSTKPNAYNYHYPMFWDPRYQAYRDRFLHAYAENLRRLAAAHPGWRKHFVLVRGQSLTHDSENIPSMGRDLVTINRKESRRHAGKELDLVPAGFEPPRAGGRVYDAPYRPEHGMPYCLGVHDAYAAAFGPLGILTVYKPDVGGRYGEEKERDSETGRRSIANRPGLGFWVTCARPDSNGYKSFYGFTDTGLVRGYFETYNKSPSNDVQFTHWIFLGELNTGVDFLGCYAVSVHHAEYQAEYEDTPNHVFYNRHVGWKPHPDRAPGAWIALKPPTPLDKQRRRERCGHHYGAFIEEDLTDDGEDVLDVGMVRYTYTGPADLGHPPVLENPMRYARTCKAGGELRFRLDPRFRQKHGGRFTVSVVYHDDKPGKWAFVYDALAGGETTVPVTKKGTGKWCKAKLSRSDAGFGGGMANQADFALRSETETTFHLIELTPAK
ncbi:MAG: hypothetical protein JXR37_28070 [Kiritimatiellae bacterium]|nr:hypothetical protein [Kiritimatiellia bacterium]